MTKRARKSAPRARSDEWFQTTIRIPEQDRPDLQRVAEFDGFDSIPQWIMHLASLRAKRVLPAIESGEYVEIQGRNVLLSDIPKT